MYSFYSKYYFIVIYVGIKFLRLFCLKINIILIPCRHDIIFYYFLFYFNNNNYLVTRETILCCIYIFSTYCSTFTVEILFENIETVTDLSVFYSKIICVF